MVARYFAFTVKRWGFVAGVVLASFGCRSASSPCVCPNECPGETGVKCYLRELGKYMSGGSKTPLQTGVPVPEDDVQKVICSGQELGWKVLPREKISEVMAILTRVGKATADISEHATTDIPEDVAEVYYELPVGYIYFFVTGSRDDFGVVIVDRGFLHREEFYAVDRSDWNELLRLLQIELPDSDADEDPFADK